MFSTGFSSKSWCMGRSWNIATRFGLSRLRQKRRSGVPGGDFIDRIHQRKDKPGAVISKDDADLVKHITRKDFTSNYSGARKSKSPKRQWHRTLIIAPYWVQATLRNRGKAILDKNGQLWSNDGQPWIGGDPFPEPKAAFKQCGITSPISRATMTRERSDRLAFL